MKHFEVEERDVPYREHDGISLLARLYQPQGPDPFPAAIDVHGGAWTSGDRFQNAPIDATLAARGVVVLALEFRMPPQACYPAAVADVNYGIRWLKAHATEFATRPELVGGIGSSSGGQTVLLAALKPDDPRFLAFPLDGCSDAGLAFVVACWPVADPLARYRQAQRNGDQHLVQSHDAYWVTEEAMAEGNPQLILERGERVRTPPLLILQGTDDANVTPNMADRFAAAYHDAGGEVRLEKFAGQPHSFVKRNTDTQDAARALTLMSAFIHDTVGARADHGRSSSGA